MHKVKVVYAEGGEPLILECATEMDISLESNYLHIRSVEDDAVIKTNDATNEIPPEGDIVIPMYRVAYIIDFGYAGSEEE